MFDVELNGISKKFGHVVAVENVSMRIEKGSFQTLLGPSGCGKTTILRIIAGLVEPDQGDVYIKGIKVNHLPPHKRDVALVFQNYALFPHMTVYDNVAYSLRIKKFARQEIDQKVKSVLHLVDLQGVEHRYPRQLSGGQQQRVALARALVKEPSVLLLDEPLSNLDQKIRQQVRVELKAIQKKVGVTTIYVTHDQEEAFAISDRIYIMNQGRTEQIGNPIEIYENPRNEFVAQFIGQSNIFEGTVSSVDDAEMVISTTDGFELRGPRGNDIPKGAEVVVITRPERMHISTQGEPELENSLPALIDFISFFGSNLQYVCSSNGKRILVSSPYSGRFIHKVGDRIRIDWEAEDCIVLSR